MDPIIPIPWRNELVMVRASIDDYHKVLEDYKDFWTIMGPPSLDAWNQSLWKETHFIRSSGEAGSTLDFGFVRFGINEKQCHVFNLYVKAEHRRKGIALSTLLALKKALIENKVQSWTINVKEDNIPALRLYESLGFARSGTSCLISVETGSNETLKDFSNSLEAYKRKLEDLLPEVSNCSFQSSAPIYGSFDHDGSLLSAFQIVPYNYSKDFEKIYPFHLLRSAYLKGVLDILPRNRKYIIHLASASLPYEEVKRALLAGYQGKLLIETLALKQNLAHD